MSAAYRNSVIGLLIVWTLTGRLDDVYITDIVYLLDVLVVIVYMSYWNCWDEMGWVFWGLGGSVQVGGEVEFLTEKKISAKKCSWGLKFVFKNVPGVLKRMQTKIYFSGGGEILGCLGRPTPPPGGRAGSENDTLLPMTMICDRLKFWSGPAWRSKVIIRKPWRRKNKKK